eukprot:TRINITY_DN379_c1_g1_i8.p1 TRINITY_DN379_c1_g1~~TRINITY_DN379_c1_g1_i8.p1  ORF type:complete len:405 (-),score=37.90 TRINITY_DN379_c1_g1_i8:290-1327(-)
MYARICLLGFLVCLNFVIGQNVSKISVDENAEEDLFKFLQDQGLSFTLQTTNESIQSPVSENLNLSEISQQQLSQQQQFQQQLDYFPSSIWKYSEFIASKQLDFFQRQYIQFETSLMAILMQNICQKDFEQFGRINFNAIGVIRIQMQDGSENFCTGTLIGDEAVITLAECYLENVSKFLYQPSWENETSYSFKGVYIPDVWIDNQEHNFAVFFLSEKLSRAPRIGYMIANRKPQFCSITLLGLKKSEMSQQYKIVTCPNLPGVQEQLGIDTSICKDEICNLDDMGFEAAAPIILTCNNPITHSIIGMLTFQKDTNSQKPVAVPYMFSGDIFWDIFQAVNQQVPP